jgi:hypothetical protein
MLGGLAERDLQNAKKKQIDIHKSKLTLRASILKGGTLRASEAWEIKKEKEVKAAIEALKKAKVDLAKVEREERDLRYRYGVKDKAAERSRKKWLKEIYRRQAHGIPITIPPEKLIPIRDREKEPLDEEIEAFRTKNVSLFEKV